MSYDVSNGPQSSPASTEKGAHYVPEQKEDDLLDIIPEYLRAWPLYLVAVVICLIAATLYIVSQLPSYPVTLSVLFLDQEDKKGPNALGNLDLMNLAGGMSNVNVQNELQIIKSREIVKLTIEESGMYVKITSKKGLKKQAWFAELPFRISMTPQALSQIKDSFSFEIHNKNGSYNIIRNEGDDHDFEAEISTLPATVNTPYGVIAFNPNSSAGDKTFSKLNVEILSPLRQAIYYSERGGLRVSDPERGASVVQIGVNAENKTQGETFLNKLVEVYNRERTIDKDIVAHKTYDFINERIAKIGSELTDTEVKLEGIKRSEGLTDFQDLGTVVQTNVELQRQRVEIETQQAIMNALINFVSKEDDMEELVPNSIEVRDATLNAAIQGYNELVTRRNSIAEVSGPQHPTLQALNAEIAKGRKNILESATAAKYNLEIGLNNIRQQERRFSGRIANAPTFERISNDILREREIRANLYLMLLQKREETSIELASSAESARIIDPALASPQPATPRKPLIYLIGLFMGLLLPTLYIFLRRLIQTKIESEEDLRKNTDAPILGVIRELEENLTQSELIVTDESRHSIESEIFRTIRTNVNFMNPNRDASSYVIMVTSTTPKEGKTFVSSNLAASFASLGKKTLLIGMDLRNPQLKRIFNISHEVAVGVSDYLSDTDFDLSKMIIQESRVSNLYLLQSGTIPPNSAELLSSQRLERLLSELRSQFEHIIIDSAPVGPVVDSLIANRIADVTLYVVRANYNTRKDIEYLNYLRSEGKLKNVGVIANRLNKKMLTYGRSYGYGYGYGKHHEKKNK